MWRDVRMSVQRHGYEYRKHNSCDVAIVLAVLVSAQDFGRKIEWDQSTKTIECCAK